MVPGGFLWLFLVQGQFWFQVGFNVFFPSKFQVGFSWFPIGWLWSSDDDEDDNDDDVLYNGDDGDDWWYFCILLCVMSRAASSCN